MDPKFKEIVVAIMMAGIVAGGALGFSARAKAGPMDQGPHILIAQGIGVHATWAPLASYRSKEECLAVRDSLFKAFGKAYGVLACIPGRNT